MPAGIEMGRRRLPGRSGSRAVWTAGLAALLVLPGAVAAQEPAAKPAEAVPAPAPAAPAEELDPKVERQRNTAAKLAGMVRFVDASCPNLVPDYDRFKRMMAALNVELKELETGSLLGQSLSYGRAYQKDGNASCERILGLFGDQGTVVAGLVGRKPQTAPKDGAAPTQAPAPTPAPSPGNP